jgi:hypothetical protein
MSSRALCRLLSLAVLALAGAAAACPVCGYASDSQRLSYLLGTAALSLLPLGMVGGFVGYLVVHHRRADRAAAKKPGAGGAP